MRRRTPLAAALLLLAACGSGGDQSAAPPPADSVAAAPGAPAQPDMPGRADDVARQRVDDANAAAQARQGEVDALSEQATGGGN